LWISTQEGHLVVLADGRFTEVAVPGVPKVTAYRFYEDRQGVLWIAIDGYGLLRISGGRLSRLTVADGLAGNAVYALFEDREGSLWVGTSGGLSHLSRRVLEAYSVADGLAEDNAYAIAQDREGGLWIGGSAGRLTHYRDGAFTR